MQSRAMSLKVVRHFSAILRGGAILALLLSATACSGLKREWPNLATVPARESAFTKTPRAKSAIALPARPDAMGQGAALDENAVVKAVEEDIGDLRRQFATAKSGIQTADRDYRTAIGALSVSKGGIEALTTAQLHLSRLTRHRDILRNIAEKLERRGQDLNDLATRPTKLAEALADFRAEVAGVVKVWNAFAAGELDRMAVLSAEGPAGKLAVNSLAVSIDESAVANLGAAKASTQFIIRVSGTSAALANKNPSVIAAMNGLVGQGVPLENIALTSEISAHDPARIMVYMQPR